MRQLGTNARDSAGAFGTTPPILRDLTTHAPMMWNGGVRVVPLSRCKPSEVSTLYGSRAGLPCVSHVLTFCDSARGADDDSRYRIVYSISKLVLGTVFNQLAPAIGLLPTHHSFAPNDTSNVAR